MNVKCYIKEVNKALLKQIQKQQNENSHFITSPRESVTKENLMICKSGQEVRDVS